MAHIRSRKHPNLDSNLAGKLDSNVLSNAYSNAIHPLFGQSLVALAAFAVPMAVHAQQAPVSSGALPEVKVQSSADVPYKADTVSNPKFTQPLVDTPQTISVIKKEIIQEQGATNLTEALRNTPGVGAFFLGENGSTNTGDAVFMRGFDTSSSIFVDGVRDLGSISRDVFNIEQIEVGKGPNGTDYGRSSPTGAVNLVTKQPTLKDAYSGSLGFGSAKYKRATADINKVIGQNSAVRFNVVREDSGVAGRDVVDNSKTGFAASLALGLKTPTRIYFDLFHMDQKNTPDGGVPTIGLPGYTTPDTAASLKALKDAATAAKLPYTGPNAIRTYLNSALPLDPTNFYGSSSDYDNVKADMFTAIIEHDLAPLIKIRNVSRFGKTKQNYLLTAFMGTTANLKTTNATGDLPPSLWTLARSTRTLKAQENQILTNQTNVTASLKTGAISHDISTGVELISEKQITIGYGGTGTLPAANLYHPNPSDTVTGLNLVPNGVGTNGQTSTVGVYFFDTLKFGESWQLLGGARVDHYTTDYSAVALSTATSNPKLPVGTLVPTSLSDSGSLVNWKVAGLYKPAENGSVYISYATSKQPPGGSNFALSTSANSAANPGFDPQEAKTAEIGTKWDLLHNELALTAAVYDTSVSNEIVQATDLNYYQTGKKEVKGVELGLIGQITHAWSASVGYTTMRTKVGSGPVVTADGSNNLAYTPKQAFTAWTTYKFPFGLSVGGGARFVDSLLRGTDGAVGTPKYTNSYWVADAMAAYTLTKNIDLQLNLYNLGDKQYVGAINKSGYRYTPGTPRSARLSANFKF